jgi:ADP-ribosylglycohydrolase
MIQSNSNSTISHASRIRGGIIGTAIGDALGVPVEFRSRASIKDDPVSGMRGWGTHNQPPGTWSDDTSMTLCVLESLVKAGWDIDDQAVRFTRWLSRAHLTAHDEVFDAGSSTVQAIDRIADGYAPLEAGCFEESSNGNGSLMRNLPAALYCAFTADDEQMCARVGETSAITHAHPRSRLGCVIHAFIISELLNGDNPGEAILHTRGRLERVLTESLPGVEMNREIDAYHWLLNCNLELAEEHEIASSGYVVDTLTAAAWSLLTSSSFTECVLKAVNLGDDTDTTGAVAGGLAGVCWGIESIPADWIGTLAKSEMIASMADDFSDCLISVKE